MNKGYGWFILALAAVLYLPGLGLAHLFDWDEINFAESAREMLLTKDFLRVQINFQTFWEKPPIFIWLQAISMALLGVGEYAARLPNALIGIVTLVFLYSIGRKLQDWRFGIWWACLHGLSLLPHIYFKSGIIDPLFNLLIIGSFWHLFQSQGLASGLKHPVLGGVFGGLAVLTKGPVALLMIGLVLAVAWASGKMRPIMPFKRFAVSVLVGLAVSASWFLAIYFKHGGGMIQEFFDYQVRLFATPDAGHSQPWFYHLVVILIGCFPASIFAFGGFQRQHFLNPDTDLWRKWMVILLATVLIVFSIVQTKIVHYSSLAYFPVSFCAAIACQKRMLGSWKMGKVLKAVGIAAGLILGLALAAIPYVGAHKAELSRYINDKFAVANLEARVHWGAWEPLLGIGFLAAVIIGFAEFNHPRKRKAGAMVLIISTAIFAQILIYIMVPRIERYTQGAAISYAKTASKTGGIIEPIGYKSYAHLFYGQRKPPASPGQYSADSVLYGSQPAPVYILTRTDREGQLPTDVELREIDRRNGFILLRRLKAPKP